LLANNAEGTFSAIIERRQRVLAMQSAFGHWVIRRRRPRHHRRNRRGADDYRRGVGAQPAAAATALSGKIASAKVTTYRSCPARLRWSLCPQKDTTDTSGTTKKAVDEPSSSQKGDTSATADKPNHPRLKLPKKDADNSGASSKHEPKKADKQSVSAGAKQK
jgi:hypothetical protein